MRFAPKSEQEAAATNGNAPLPPGRYPFEVVKALDKTSSKGNEMIELWLKVFHGKREPMVFDYLVNTHNWQFKIRHFAYGVGMGQKYEAGGFVAQDCVGRSGYVELEIKPGNAKYPEAKNKVTDYICAESTTQAVKAAKTAPTREQSNIGTASVGAYTQTLDRFRGSIDEESEDKIQEHWVRFVSQVSNGKAEASMSEDDWKAALIAVNPWLEANKLFTPF